MGPGQLEIVLSYLLSFYYFNMDVKEMSSCLFVATYYSCFFFSFCAVDSYLIASHTTDYQYPMLLFNTVAVLVLVIAKFPNMHKVRIFGINGDL